MAKKAYYTMEVQVPVSLIRKAASIVVEDLDDWDNSPVSRLEVSVGKITAALAADEEFSQEFNKKLLQHLEWELDDLPVYDWSFKLDKHLRRLFPEDWEKAVVKLREEKQRELAAENAAKETRELAKTAKRIQVFIPKQTKGFTTELAALLEKYDGKMSEDMS